jgi:hypothetical protein
MQIQLLYTPLAWYRTVLEAKAESLSRWPIMYRANPVALNLVELTL